MAEAPVQQHIKDRLAKFTRSSHALMWDVPTLDAFIKQLILRDYGGVIPGPMYVLTDGSRAMLARFNLSPLPPTDPEHATHKHYVDLGDQQLQDQIDLLVSGQVFVGAYDVAIDHAVFSSAAGLLPGPLPPANTFAMGSYLACITGGQGTGQAPNVIFKVGDQIISDGQLWYRLAVGGPLITAIQVAILPTIGGWDNVHDALEGLLAQKVDRAGDVMTGTLYLPPIAPIDPDQAISKFYVDLMAGAAVQKMGDTMTGTLSIVRSNPFNPLILGGAAHAGNPTECWQIELSGGPRSCWIASTSDFGGGAGIEGDAIHFWTNDHNGTAWPINAVWCGKFTNGGLALGNGSAAVPAIRFGAGPNWNYTAHGFFMPNANTIQAVIGAAGVFDFNDAVNLSRRPFIVQPPSGPVAAIQAKASGGGAPMIAEGGHIIMSTDGYGLVTFGNGMFYKKVGTGLVIRQSVGNPQPQIENNDGTNIRPIIDQTSGDARYVNKSGDSMQGSLTMQAGNRIFIQTNTGNNQGVVLQGGTGAGANTQPLRFESTRIGRDGGLMGDIICESSGYAYYGESARFKFRVEMGGYGPLNWIWGGFGNPPSLNCSGAVNANAAIVAPSEAKFKTGIREVREDELSQAFSGLKLRKFRRVEPKSYEPEPEQYGLIVEDMEAAIPEAIRDLSDPDGNTYKGYSLDQVVALLVGQVQQLKAQSELITQLQEQLATLEERFSNKIIADMEGQLARLREVATTQRAIVKENKRPRLPEK